MSSDFSKPGISVIIPAYIPDDGSVSSAEVAVSVSDGPEPGTLAYCVDSLARQSLDFGLFDVIVVLNGPGVKKFDIAGLIARHPQLNVQIIHNLTAGAGHARNSGIMAARRTFLTFVDADDAVEKDYLRVALSNAQNNVCVLMPIIDMSVSLATATTPSAVVRRDESNSLNVRIRALAGSAVSLSSVAWALGFNACKILPTHLVQKYRYSQELASGEDVVFFANVLRHPDIALKVPKLDVNAAYLRTLTIGSISRREKDFDFSVRQRLACIAKLRQIEVPEGHLLARQSLENAQFAFIRDFLEENKGFTARAINEAVDLGVAGLDWEDLRTEKARTAVFSYCFPPYSDTSANVVSKLIRQNAELVDVYYANMSRVRHKDLSTRLIVDPYVVHAEEIMVEPSFANWGLICTYARKAMRAAKQRARMQGGYEKVYSRALWSGSHVAAALFKAHFPHVYWEAEFSDPMRVGVKGELRPGPLSGNRTTRELRRQVEHSPWKNLSYETHFDLTELVTLIGADAVAFTNANQRHVMLEPYPVDFRNFVTEKSILRPHTVPPSELYSMVTSDYQLEPGLIHVGYFGNFYGNRGLEEVFQVVANMRSRSPLPIQFHIFTSAPQKVREQLWSTAIHNLVRVNDYVPYLEFLNLASKFDALLVNDTDITGTQFDINPFLPSKYADYAGSGAAVWGLTNPGSPLSKLPLQLSSTVGDPDSVQHVIQNLIDKIVEK